MVVFKVYGERNSGTNFVEQLLIKNKFKVLAHKDGSQKNQENQVSYWKHGVPCEQHRKEFPKIVDIFVIRPLKSWLVSMFKNPYHLKTKPTFQKFLTETQESNGIQVYDKHTGKMLGEDDADKTIFDIRYYKIKKILEYKNTHNNTVLVNLAFLQKKEKNVEFFLKKLHTHFNDDKCQGKKYITSLTHTKNGKKKCKNREYNINIEKFKGEILKQRDPTIEDFVLALTLQVNS